MPGMFHVAIFVVRADIYITSSNLHIFYHTIPYLTFLHLTLPSIEFETMNKIGTIRDQYEWQPATDSSEWVIEEEKLSKVQPLIDFINHAGELKSTKVLFDII